MENMGSLIKMRPIGYNCPRHPGKAEKSNTSAKSWYKSIKVSLVFFATYKYRAKVTLCNVSLITTYTDTVCTHGYTIISTLSKYVNILFIHLTFNHCPFLLRKIFPPQMSIIKAFRDIH
jgi:hypothetical protein